MDASRPELLRTAVVGSYPQPEWLVNKTLLRGQFVPRVTTDEIWRVDAEFLNEALRDATIVAICDMEAAGIDVITDGEICRESYTTHFSASLAGLDHEQPAVVLNRTGRAVRVPRVVSAIRHQSPVEVGWARLLRAHTTRLTKVTLPGPFSLAQQVKDEYYGDPETLALEFAAAVNAEARLLETTGIDVIQLDEPWLRNDPQAARAFGVRALNRALEGLRHVTTAVHVCFGYAFLRQGQKPNAYDFLAELADANVQEISLEAAQPRIDLGVLKDLSAKNITLGVLDHSTAEPEPMEIVAGRIRAALNWIAPEQLIPAPDCGMKYMSRDMAFARLKNLVAAAAAVRRELAPEGQ